MKTIPISSIIIANRQRRDFDEAALVKLSTSIRQKGLFHPIILQNDAETLVAGERRVKAIAMLGELDISITHDEEAVPLSSIPYVTVRELSLNDLMEAELEENVLREDLTWQEEADAVARLHTLRTGQTPGQTYKATAEEILGGTATSSGMEKVRHSMLLTEHLSDPEIAKAKSAKEALKLIKKKKQAELTAQLAKQFNITASPHHLHQGDFREATHSIPSSSIDVVCTDPPYGIGADSFGSQADATHAYNDTPEYFKEIISAFVVELARVTKPQAHAYIFCAQQNLPHIQDLLTRSGWVCWPVPLIWNKGNGMLPEPDYGPRRTYEVIIFANKGRKPITAVYSDVITIPGLTAPRFGAEKPFELYENLLRRSVKPCDRVWDPFAGAGPIFPAANLLNIIAIGSEMIEEKYNYAKLRLKENLP